MTDEELLRTCQTRLGSSLGPESERALRAWWQDEQARSRPLTDALLARGDAEWGQAIDEHRAHRHRWYDLLACDVNVDEYAAFMLENWAYPSFLALVEKTLAVQVTEEGRRAIQRNIDDEHVPVPHADLMRRVFVALKKRASAGISLAMYRSLADRTLVFYYGYYCEPWHLIGSLYATEAMARHRMLHMGRGLERLGFSADDREYIRIHLECDDDHARDWSDGVVEPSFTVTPALRIPVAEGIASCLETSARYLDDLVRRADDVRARPASLADAPVAP